MTLNTSMKILLNSSKQHQVADVIIPLKNFAIINASIASEQLKTMQNLPITLLKSLIVSVLPVPAGPTGAPPKLYFIAHNIEQ